MLCVCVCVCVMCALCRCQFWKMEMKENSQRQRLKLVANTHGSLHEDARRREGQTEEKEEDEVHPVGMPLQSGSLMTSSHVDEGSLSSDELLEPQLTDQDQGDRSSDCLFPSSSQVKTYF